jgi:ATP synthase I chain
VEAETIPTTEPESPELARAEARLPRWMMGFALLGVGASLALDGARFAAGVALGAVLAILGYYWLHQAIDRVLAAGRARLPRRVIAKFAVRYPLAVGAVFVFYKTGWLPFGAILTGLFVPVGGVLAEAVVQIARGWRLTTGKAPTEN